MGTMVVIGMFDEPAAIERARSALVRRGVATEAAIRSEPEALPPELDTDRGERKRGLWGRLKRLLSGESDDVTGAYAEGVRRGAVLLIVTVPDERTESARDVMRSNGAIDMRRRIQRWKASGWTGYDTSSPTLSEGEFGAERVGIAAEGGKVGSGTGGSTGPRATQSSPEEEQPHADTVRLINEATGQEIGRISEAELAFLQEALEEEGPDDDDYWINPETIERLESLPGATAHLISILRSATGDSPCGVDILFHREGESARALRGASGRRVE